jgi:hypothetical protein
VEFKFKVVLEALKGLKRVSELASTYEVHSTLINRWKKELQEGGELFLVFPSARSMDGRGQAWTTSLWSACGDRSTMRMCISRTMAVSLNWRQD